MTVQIRDLAVYAIAIPYKKSKIRDVAVYGIVPQPAMVDVRQVHGYAMVEDPALVNVRTLFGYAMVAPFVTKYFGFKGVEALLKAINLEHGTAILPDQITFGDPSVETEFFDTGVVVTPVTTWLYSGTQKFLYNRFALPEAFAGKPMTKPAGAFTTTHAWLPTINTTFGLQLEPRDIVLRNIPANQAYLVLEVAATSYLYRPGSKVTLGDPANDLGNMITVSDLNGFEP